MKKIIKMTKVNLLYLIWSTEMLNLPFTLPITCFFGDQQRLRKRNIIPYQLKDTQKSMNAFRIRKMVNFI